MLHNFRADLSYERQDSHYHLLRAACQVVWGVAMSGMVYCTDLARQKNGIDWTVALHTGRSYTMDAKIRRRDYGDLALEYEHDYGDARQKPGWADKPLACDLIAYLIVPTRVVYLIPWPGLRDWWTAERDTLLARYPTITAHNPGYDTRSLLIPLNLLAERVPHTQVVRL